MSDVGDLYRDIGECRVTEGIVRRRAASDDFQSALRRCNAVGLLLKRHNATHYSLTHPVKAWRLNIHPGNRRIYMDRNRPKAPFLKLPEDWSLEDVVTAAILANEGKDDEYR
jgi:hypothetical protein